MGALGSGLLSFGYLWAISIGSVSLAVVFSVLMWGIVYQGYNATFPSFYPELFPTRTRVTSMAVAQNIGTMITAFLPAIFTMVAPPGAAGIPWVIGGITLTVTLICFIACLSARETYRIPVNDLGEKHALDVPREEYLQVRRQTSTRS